MLLLPLGANPSPGPGLRNSVMFDDFDDDGGCGFICINRAEVLDANCTNAVLFCIPPALKLGRHSTSKPTTDDDDDDELLLLW